MKEILNQSRLILVILVIFLLSAGRADCIEIRSFPNLQKMNETNILYSDHSDITGDLLKIYTGRNTQEPEDSLTKAEIRSLRREARAERRAQDRLERNANRRVIDNPRHADYIFLGEDLPRGRSLLDALTGRVPGMMISDGRVVVRGPSSFYGGGTPLYLVDEMEVSSDFANSLVMEEIDRVEIFTGPSAAIYGSRVGTAVISVFTKNSMNQAPLEE